ncbi:hypothetical protein [Phyllobacterium zundukense]|uniref:Uncharacterized protein n=1 Tax=Phyllobacterium zundukense TaxID=1867719 RepID=A0A2N9W4V4_9HYPH|nr:hypothetical protein [Phyllobacterium zundukense]ATU91762.1 hypothetical protein BLM14_09120 [Phyllobacterium zundukense]PIO46772.1 hypothetical protein B5P45_02955 [Phyllobacterium zundukense]
MTPNPLPKKKSKRKSHHTERYRGSKLLVERWTNAKAAHVAFLTGKGVPSTEIARILNDGVHPATIRAMWRRWRLPMAPTGGRHPAAVPINLYADERGLLAKRAKKLDVTPEEYLRRIAVCAISDDLYAAVTDGKFDKK